MTCKDCIHKEVCDAFIQSGCPYLDEAMPADAFCVAFTNKADIAPKSEWISAEERLPDLESTLIKWGDLGYKQKSIRVLCVCKQKSGKVLVKEGYYEVWTDSPTDPYWKIPGSIDSVTHWMPLPEAPKMKGGEE